jgi:ubiquinone/menaquinone biosynthesis C-methylase UbiE
MLMRVSKRVLRNVVDNETAVTDIADVYANDGEHLVNELLQRQDGECKELWDDMSCNKTTLKKEMTESLKALARERKRISALP